MTYINDIQEIPTYSSSKIKLEISTNILENNNISRITNINLDQNKGKSEYLESFDYINTSFNFLNPNNDHEDQYSKNEKLDDSNIFFMELNNKNQQKENKPNNVIFTTVLKKKRGRKEGQISNNKKKFGLNNNKKIYSNKNKNKNKNKIIHDNTTQDNLQRKINVHFLNFLINISNDVIKSEIKDQIFNLKYLDYKIKQKIDEKFLKKLKNSSLKKIIEMDISPKFSKSDKEENKININKICQMSDWLNNFFNMTYLNLLKFYYSEQKQIKKIKFDKKEIFFSEKTETFYDLLNYKRNESIKEKLKKIFLEIFFYDNGKILFDTKK